MGNEKKTWGGHRKGSGRKKIGVKPVMLHLRAIDVLRLDALYPGIKLSRSERLRRFLEEGRI